jgi:hypothetical protein
VLTLGLVITVQTTYVFSQLPGTPVFYKQFAEHLAWTTGNAGCVQPLQHCRWHGSTVARLPGDPRPESLKLPSTA